MTRNEQVQIGFLAWCIDNGKTAGEAVLLAKRAAAMMEKKALLGQAVDWLGAAALGIPVAAGGAVGALANHMADTDLDEEDFKLEELRKAYEAAAAQARQMTIARKLKAVT